MVVGLVHCLELLQGHLEHLLWLVPGLEPLLGHHRHLLVHGQHAGHHVHVHHLEFGELHMHLLHLASWLVVLIGTPPVKGQALSALGSLSMSLQECTGQASLGADP